MLAPSSSFLSTYFNSIKVRLKPPPAMSLLTYNAHFNSRKVRLEQIASSVDSINVAFQFHKGTIKTYMQKEGDGAKVNFNSIKVRLKQSIVHDNNKFILEFQFHKGTIKTILQMHILRQDFLHFNSIKVRLKQYCSWEI